MQQGKTQDKANWPVSVAAGCLLMGIIYAAFWLIVCFAEWEIFNPFASKPGRGTFGIAMLLGLVIGTFKWVDDDAQTPSSENPHHD